jgi:hypothetical protein
VKKEDLRKQMENAGDAIVTYKSPKSKKTKYNICTLDFSTRYIQQKSNRAKETNDTLLMFCWDTDSYRLMKPENVTSVVPLSNILRNEDVN